MSGYIKISKGYISVKSRICPNTDYILTYAVKKYNIISKRCKNGPTIPNPLKMQGETWGYALFLRGGERAFFWKKKAVQKGGTRFFW